MEIGDHGTIIGGPVLYDLADTPEVMRWYRELLPSLPEELSGFFALLSIPAAPPFPAELWGRKACGILWCYTGAHNRADEVLKPVRTFGSPLIVGLQAMPSTMPQSAQLPTGMSAMHLHPLDGAASRVPADATAFGNRDGGWAGVILGVDSDPANAGRISRWAHYWAELHPTSAGGSYVNFLMDEGQDRVKASYRGNYDRLAQVKARYDPGNIFHVNQNIQPANGTGPE